MNRKENVQERWTIGRENILLKMTGSTGNDDIFPSSSSSRLPPELDQRFAREFDHVKIKIFGLKIKDTNKPFPHLIAGGGGWRWRQRQQQRPRSEFRTVSSFFSSSSLKHCVKRCEKATIDTIIHSERVKGEFREDLLSGFYVFSFSLFFIETKLSTERIVGWFEVQQNLPRRKGEGRKSANNNNESKRMLKH